MFFRNQRSDEVNWYSTTMTNNRILFKFYWILNFLGISDVQLQQIFRILCGLLHFGNVNFEQTVSQECTLDNSKSDGHLILATKLWGVQESGLRKWLRYRLLTAGNETIHQGLNASQVFYYFSNKKIEIFMVFEGLKQ